MTSIAEWFAPSPTRSRRYSRGVQVGEHSDQTRSTIRSAGTREGDQRR
jgi:hypothetical protein